MAIAQSDFTTFRGRGYDGQVSTIDVSDVVSRTVENGLLQFGRAAVRGTGTRSCAPVTGASTAGDVIGFAVRSLAEFSNTPPANPDNYQTGYDIGHVASLIREGRMYATCLGGASAGGTVHVVINTAGGEELGQLRGAADSTNTIELNQVRWIDDVVDGEIGEIQIDGILTTA